MSDAGTPRDGQVRASDHERDEAVARLQRGFTDGRLSQAELTDRVGTALAARTRAELQALTADLPGAVVQQARPPAAAPPWLAWVLLAACPPAGVAYLLLCRRGSAATWLSARQLAGIPHWVWVLVLWAAVAAAGRR